MGSDLIIVDDRIRMSKKSLDLSKMAFEKILEVRENIHGYEG
jgi:oxygen-independent coproporphyrinogen-3 oxidase